MTDPYHGWQKPRRTHWPTVAVWLAGPIFWLAIGLVAWLVTR